MNRAVRLLLLVVVLAISPSAADVGEKAKVKRRVFVVHSGIHTILANPSLNIGAERLADGLIRRGISPADVVIMSNPFPRATWSNMFPREAIEMYFESMTPTSKTAQDAYMRMDRALKEKRVTADDE